MGLTATAAELQGKRITVRVSDAAPKAVADALLVIETYGDPSALYPDDVSAGGFAPSDAGTAQLGTANTIQLKAAAPSVSLRDQLLVIVSGTGAGQSGTIKSYDTSTKIATMSKNWPTTNPDNTSKYVVMPVAAPDGDSFASALVVAVG